MARIRDRQVTTANATSITPPTFTSQLGDLLVQVQIRDGGGVTMGTPIGYTASATNTAGNLSSAIFTKVAGVSESPQSSSWAGATDTTCWLFVIEDVDGTTPINQIQIDAGSTQTPQAPNLTTTANDTFNLYFFGVDTGGNPRQLSLEPGLMWGDRPYPGAALEVAEGWTYQESLGSIDRPSLDISTSRQTHRLTLCIASGGTPVVPAHTPYSSPATEIIHPLTTTTSYSNYGGAERDVSGVAELNGLINGVTFGHNNGTGTAFSGLSDINADYKTQAPANGSAIQQWGSCKDFTSIDLDAKIVAVGLRAPALGAIKGLDDDGVVVGLRSDVGDFRLWAVGGLDTSPALSGYNTVVFQPDSATFELEEVGTFIASTSIGFVLSSHKALPSGTRNVIGSSEFHVVNTNVIVGGTQTFPATLTGFMDSLKASKLRLVQAQGGASQRQVFSLQQLQIGDGSLPTYFADPNTSLEFSASANIPSKAVQLQLPAGTLGFTLYGVSGDTIDLSSIVMSCENDWYYTVDASSTSAATWVIVAHTIIGATVTLQDVFTAASGFTFSGCIINDLNGADLSGGCVFSDTLMTVTTEGELTDVSNGTFVNSATAILITGDQTGTWTEKFLAVDNNTFDIEYSGSTNFSLSSATALSVNNSGSGVLTVITPDIVATIEVNVTGAEITILEDGTQTELYHVETGGLTQTFIYTYTSDFDGDIQVFKQGFKPFWRAANEFSNVNQTIPVTLEAEPASQI